MPARLEEFARNGHFGLVGTLERVEAIGKPTPPRYSRDGTIGLVQLDLERPATDIDASSGKRLIELAEQATA